VRQTVIVYGNCQADAIVAILSRNPLLSQLFRFVYMRSFAHPTDGPMALPDEDLAACAIVAEQHDPRAFPYRDRLPEGCPIVTFPSVDSNMLWPFNATNTFDAPEPPLFPFGRFPYGDRIISGCIAKGMGAKETLAYYLGGWDHYKLDLDRLMQIETTRLRSRDDHCDVKMLDYTLGTLAKRRLYWTVNHPAPDLLRELTVRLVRRCFNANQKIEEEADIEGTIKTCFGKHGPLGVIGVPIHPRVAEHLELEWYDPDERLPYYGGGTLSYLEYFQELIESSLRRKALAAV
jgi:hypothetical protein